VKIVDGGSCWAGVEDSSLTRDEIRAQVGIVRQSQHPPELGVIPGPSQEPHVDDDDIRPDI
jgi:hypothetical protein